MIQQLCGESFDESCEFKWFEDEKTCYDPENYLIVERINKPQKHM